MGWIKLDRQIMDNFLWKPTKAEPFDKRSAWIDLLLMATHEDEAFTNCHGQVVNLSRGQLLIGRKYLADRWCWSEAKVRRYIKMLENQKMCTAERTKNGTTLTLVNYSKFQDGRPSDDTSNETCSDTCSDTSNETHSRNKEYKNKRNTTNSWLEEWAEREDAKEAAEKERLANGKFNS